MLRWVFNVPQEFIDVILAASNGAVFVYVYGLADVFVYGPTFFAVDNVVEGVFM